MAGGIVPGGVWRGRREAHFAFRLPRACAVGFIARRKGKDNVATIQAGKSPGQRVAAGALVLDRAKTNDVTAVKKRLSAFAGVQREYVSAHEASRKAGEALMKQERVLGEGDAAQDVTVEVLASALVGDGAKRTKPFAACGGPSVSDLQSMPVRKEAELLKKLAARASKGTSDAKVKKAAAAAITAADAVLKASVPLAALTKARDQAQNQRDGIGPRWEKAFAVLKRGVKAAEDEGAAGLFEALFAVDAPTKKKSAPSAPSAPGPTAPVVPPS
jgi:hypothetical protein